MADSAGQIGLDLVINQSQFNSQLNGIQKLAKKAGAAIAGAFAFKKVFDFGKQCIELGSDLAEVQNVVDVTFSKMSSQVDEFAKDAIQNFGLSETMAKQFTGTFGAMAKAFGFSEQQAYDMSTALTGLAGDVASFYNISQDEAFTKLKSVFSGETESLKDLGIVMTQTALDQYALANGFGKTTSAMTEQEKVALRYAFVQQQLATASGDFARTSDGWANQIRILSLQFDSLKASIGQGLINVFTPVLKMINTVLGRLMTLANAFKSFTAMLMGKKASSASSSVKSVASSADDATESINNASSAASDLSDSTTSAGNAAKNAAKKMRSLMGFDQINKVSESTDSSTGSTGSTGDGGTGSGSVSAGSVDMGSLPTESDTTTAVKGFGKLQKAIDKLKDSFGKFSNVVKGAFQWIWKNMLVPLGKWTMNSLAPKLIELLAAGFDVLTSVCKALQPLWQWAWDKLFKPLAKFAGDAIIKFLDVLVKGLEGLSKWIDKHQGAVQAIVVAFLSFKTVSKVVGIISKFAEVISFLGGPLKILKTLFTIARTAIMAFAGSLNLPVIIIAALVTAGVMLYKNWDKIKEKLGTFTKAFKKKWEEIKIAIYQKIVSIIRKISELKHNFTELKKNAVKRLSEIKKTISKKIDGIIKSFKDLPKKIKEAFKKKIEGIENWFSGIEDSFSDTLSNLKDSIPDLSDIKDAISEKIGDAEAKITGTLDTSKDWWSDIKSGISDKIGEIKKTVSAVKDRAFDTVKEAWDSIKDKTSSLIAEAKEKSKGAIKGIKDAFDTVKNKTATLTTKLADKIGSKLSSIKKNWDSIKSKTASMSLKFSAAASDLKKWINTNVIDRVNAKFKKVPILKNHLIPPLAQGGFIKKNTPQLAMIGDNRHQGEVVAPEDKMLAMAKKAAELSGGGYDAEIVNLLRQILSALNSMNLTAYVDVNSLKKLIVQLINDHTRATGVCEINV